MKSKPDLTTKDHANMKAFLGHVLDDYKSGVITKEQAIAGIAHTMAALDLDNYEEARHWLEQGRKLIRFDPAKIAISNTWTPDAESD
ncbi:MAG: hypothetical protein KZQ97_13905 [Candidatus Thiodiazotropha sp. (ex Dulcina madagascariensis)]|nr:hypothetical protein [Candidatus Thiodiazotropha sp. (ex Dulcina madagascariensis)]